MNRNDTIDVLTAVQAIDRRTVGEAEITGWAAALGDLPRDLCLQAVLAHFREQPDVYLMPGHVYQRVRAVIRDRLDRTSIEERAAYYEAVEAKAAPEVREPASRWDANTALKHQRPKINPLRVRCPHIPCNALPGSRCVLGSGRPLSYRTDGGRSGGYHPSRKRLAERDYYAQHPNEVPPGWVDAADQYPTVHHPGEPVLPKLVPER